MPADVRKKLHRYFEPELLKEVRWTRASDRLTLDTLIQRTRPRCAAVTLDNVIVFLDPSAARQLKVWVHELEHARQFAVAGVDEFARQYVARPEAIEAATRKRAAQLIEKITRQTPPERDSAPAKESKGTSC